MVPSSMRTGRVASIRRCPINLGRMLEAQDDLDGARGHQEAVLEAQRRLLCDEQPSNAHGAHQPDRDSEGTRLGRATNVCNGASRCLNYR